MKQMARAFSFIISATLTTNALLASEWVSCSSASAPIALFNGATLDGWLTLDGKPITSVWEVEDGAIHCTGRGFSIATEKEYGDFELTFDWKIAERGNSGVKYRVRQYGQRWLGLEYQVQDDASRSTFRPKGVTGALYDLYPPDEQQKFLRPVGEYNHARIVVCGSRIEHWVNGRRLLVADTNSQQWRQAIADSKFSDIEGFGLNRMGRIMLQNHGSEAWYRNITLRPLTPHVEHYVCQQPAVVHSTCGVVCRPCAPTRRSVIRYRCGIGFWGRRSYCRW